MRHSNHPLPRFFDCARFGTSLVLLALLPSCGNSGEAQSSDVGLGSGGNETGTIKAAGGTSGSTREGSATKSTPAAGSQSAGGTSSKTTATAKSAGGSSSSSVATSSTTSAAGAADSFAGAPATGGTQGSLAGAGAPGTVIITSAVGGTSSSSGCSGPQPYVAPATAIDRCFSDKDCRAGEYCHFETCSTTCNCVNGVWNCRAGGCFTECRVKP